MVLKSAKEYRGVQQKKSYCFTEILHDRKGIKDMYLKDVVAQNPL